MRISRYFGPATLVTAAFIGPGTVTVCTLAGARYGFALLWAIVFSTLATIALQEMAARLGWVTQNGLGHAIRTYFEPGLSRGLFFFVVISAIIVGNAAYEAGNIGGAVLGLDAITTHSSFWPLVVGAIAFALLFFGRYRLISGLLVTLVLAMSVCFLATALVLKPSVSALVAGLSPTHIPAGSFLIIVGLIGTTVVPYNLFLHAAAVSEKWDRGAALRDIRIENAVAITLGGLVSAGIIVVSAAAFFDAGTPIDSAAAMATQLEPLLGRWAKLLMGVGLFAAGVSSAITAPLAAAYAARGLFGWERSWRENRFRLTWMGILIIGVVFASIGLKPLKLIQFAQIANGVLLPVIATFLLFLCNKTKIMGEYRNRVWQNIVGAAVIGVTIVLSIRALNSVFHFL